MKTPLYSLGTWDADVGAFTPQEGVTVPSMNIDRSQLRQAIRDLRELGYTAHRRRNAQGSYDDNDHSVLIERTDGMDEMEILKGWER